MTISCHREKRSDATNPVAHEIEIDVSTLEPQVALPRGVHKAVDLARVAGVPGGRNHRRPETYL